LTYRGREGVKNALERWLDSFEEYSFKIERIVERGGDEVLMAGIEVGRGPGAVRRFAGSITSCSRSGTG